MKTDPLEVLLKSILSSFIGSNSQGVVQLLYGKKNVNEFIISKKMKLTINQTRNVLYKLSDEGLVSFVRKKDKKKGGWYTYFWTLNVGKSLIKFKETLLANIDLLKKQMESKKNTRFYKCKNCNITFNEEHALNNSYTCPECGEVLEVKDMAEELSSVNKEITKTENLLERVNIELSQVLSEENKIKIKKAKAEEKKVKKAKEIKKKLNAKIRAKEKKAAGLKLIKRKNKKK